MRQNIKMNYSEGSPIYIYSHWGGNEPMEKSELALQLAEALRRKERWDDESYLARIIMAEVLREHLDDETGFGLSPYEIDPEFPTITVDLTKNTVAFGKGEAMTFDEFIKAMPTE